MWGEGKWKKCQMTPSQVSDPLRLQERRLTSFVIHKTYTKLQYFFLFSIIIIIKEIVNSIFHLSQLQYLSPILTQALLLLFGSGCSPYSIQNYSTYEVNSAILVPFPTGHFFHVFQTVQAKRHCFAHRNQTLRNQNWNGRTPSLKMKYRCCMVQFVGRLCKVKLPEPV